MVTGKDDEGVILFFVLFEDMDLTTYVLIDELDHTAVLPTM